MKIAKNKIVAMTIHGKYVAALVLEIGAKQITVYNMDTQRVCHLKVKLKAKKVKSAKLPVASPVATETAAIMTDIMETPATTVDTLMEIINKVM
jgi:hypothetical protein